MSPQSLAGTLKPEQAGGGSRRLLAYLGPATLVSVGYMDPGNWATDLEGGARFGYELLWVLVAANFIALLMQTLAARLGVVARLDLAQACRSCYPRPVVITLWALCQVAIIACDLAEVIGSAVALNLLFGIPMLWGAAITVLDVFLLLGLQRFGVRRLESLVLGLVFVVGACLAVELWLADPSWTDLAGGLKPTVDADRIYVAVAILGATVMPHNLYLHSAMVQTRAAPSGAVEQKRALRFNLIDTVVALNVAFCVNAAILIVAADVFHTAGLTVTDLREAQQLLSPLLGTGLAGLLFAVALLCAGQSSTITGTLAGQIVMSGFLRVRGSPAMVRLATRATAIVPAVAMLAIFGDDSTVTLLIATQVVLSLQLPFALVPLIRITSHRTIMGEHATPIALAGAAWAAAIVVIACNVWLVMETAAESLPSAWWPAAMLAGASALGLLGYLMFVRPSFTRYQGKTAESGVPDPT